MNKAPSNLWLSFFRWYCHPDYAEDIEGDLFERFERKIELGNVSSAQWGFARDVVRLFRPGLIRPLTQNRQQIRIDMFKNYYKVAWRHILKEKFYSATNIAGLGVGMACCMFIWLYVQYELSYDRYNKNLDSTYRVLQSFKSLEEGEGSDPAAEDYQVWGCAPLGPAMAEEFPEVDLVTQFTSPSDWLVRYEDNVFSESEILFADSNILKVFSWQMLSGNRETALDRPYTIVLTESFAKKYFGTEAALGKSLTMDQNLDFEVTGIIADVPVNSHFSFEALVSMGTFKQFRPGIFESWGYVDFYTYFILNEAADIKDMEARTAAFEKKYTGDWENNRYDITFEPMTDAYLNSPASRQPGPVGNMTNLYIFSLVGLFIIVVACINFINLSTARSVERAKEVGIRKVVGARKQALVYQFLSEFFLLSIFAGLLSLALVILLTPTLQDITAKPISYEPLLTPEFGAIFLVTLMVVGLLSGGYPAFLLSAFKPVTVLKGKFKSSVKGAILRKGLVAFQFVLTIVLIVGTAVVFMQLKYLQNRDLGFDQEQMLIIDFGFDRRVQLQIPALKKSFNSMASVISVSASRAVPGGFLPNAGTTIENQEGTMVNFAPRIYEIDTDFITDYEIEIVAGRSFSHDYATDSMEALIINESAAKLWGYTNPEDVVGKKFDQWGKTGQVIGVVNDFNYQSLHTKVEPLSLRYEPRSMSKLSIRIQSEDIPNTISFLEQRWKELVPHYPFNYRFLDASFNNLYQSDARFGRLFSVFAGLAIFIACLGLFGLTTYTTTQRTKEIGIRKVLGASVSTIVLLLSKDFSRLLVLAFIIAIPLSWYAIQGWLDGFAYRINIGAGVYILSAVTVAFIALFTMSWQSIKVALQNPVNSLKNE